MVNNSKSFIYRKFINSMVKKGKKHKIEKLFQNFYYSLNTVIFYGYWYLIKGGKSKFRKTKFRGKIPFFLNKKGPTPAKYFFNNDTNVFLKSKKNNFSINCLRTSKGGINENENTKTLFFKKFRTYVFGVFWKNWLFLALPKLINEKKKITLKIKELIFKKLDDNYSAKHKFKNLEKRHGLNEVCTRLFKAWSSSQSYSSLVLKNFFKKKNYRVKFKSNFQEKTWFSKISKVYYYYFKFSRMPHNFFVSNFLIFQIVYSLIPFLGVRMTSVQSTSKLKKKKGRSRKSYGVPITLTPLAQIIYAVGFFKRSFKSSLNKHKLSKNSSFKSVFNDELLNFLLSKNTVSLTFKKDLYKKILEFRQNFHFRWVARTGGSSKFRLKKHLKDKENVVY